MRKIITLFCFIVASHIAQATHIRCGHISLIRIEGLTYQITLNVYTNSGSEIKFGDGVLDFGDGTTPHITPTTENTLRTDLGQNIATVVYSINHTFPGSGNYVITYRENNLSEGIININNSVETKFYLETDKFRC